MSVADFLSGSYCGLPPAPGEIWARWTLDPGLLLTLGAAALGHCLVARRGGFRRTQRWSFAIGFVVLTLALVSPLCALSVSLFSARVAQHMALTLVAAPLLVVGGAAHLVQRAWRRRLVWFAEPVPAALTFAALIWFWHTPAPYAATFENTLVYWLMHLSLIASALCLWTALLRADRKSAPGAVAAGVISTVQMSLLGAWLTLAGAPLFAPHLATAPVWGFDPLSDQHFGGVIMWGPGCMAFLVSLVPPALSLLREEAPAAVAG